MPIVGGLDIHRKQLTFDYPGTVSGEVRRGQIAPADRAHLRAWLAQFAGRDDVAFALEGCTGWRYIAKELAAAGVTVHVGEPADTAGRREPLPQTLPPAGVLRLRDDRQDSACTPRRGRRPPLRHRDRRGA